MLEELDARSEELEALQTTQELKNRQREVGVAKSFESENSAHSQSATGKGAIGTAGKLERELVTLRDRIDDTVDKIDNVRSALYQHNLVAALAAETGTDRRNIADDVNAAEHVGCHCFGLVAVAR